MKVPLVRHIPCRWLLALLCVTPLGAETASLETVQKSAGDWLKVRAETARLETEWSSQRRLMDSMVRGLNERAQTIEAKRDFLRASTAKDREELAALEAFNANASTRLKVADEQLKTMIHQLLQLRASLPPRLSVALELPYKSLAAAEPTTSECMQLTMTVLNRCLQFNRSIVCEDEILKLDGDANGRQLEVIYWGLSQGYALDRVAGKAWQGGPGQEGWKWQPMVDAEAAGRVAKLITIYRGKDEPAFVELPASVQKQSVASVKK